jgi:hypothetical protein
MKKTTHKFIYATSLIAFAAVGCGSTGSSNTGPGTYALTVTSVNPVSGLALKVNPADVNSAGASGAPTTETSLSLIYKTGTAVTLTAPASSASGPFVAWVGCDSTTGLVCQVAMTKSKSVAVEYTGVSAIVINPATITAPAGKGVQIPVTVNGFGMCSLPPAYPTPQPCAGSPVTFEPPYSPSGATVGLGTVDPTTGYYTPASSSPASSVYVTVQSALAPNITAVVLIQNQQ